jgi:hypothetical protein
MLCSFSVSDAVEHKGCWFHHVKAVHENLRKRDLQKPYEKEPMFNDYIQQLTTLALIDVRHVDAAFQHLKSRGLNEFTGAAYSKLPDFLAYFEKVLSHSVSLFSITTESFRHGFAP